MAHAATQLAERPTVEIDESDVVLTAVTIGGQPYKAHPPLRFAVEYDSKHRAFQISGEFNIYFSEPDRESMLTCLNEVIEMLWYEIAVVSDDDMLTKPAMALRDEMRRRLQKVDHHA